MTLQQNSYATSVLKPTEPSSGIEDTAIQANNKPKTTLERLKQQQKMLVNRIQQVESRQRENERKQETRRKILVGAYYLDAVRKAGTMAELNQKMANFLTRDSDKILFGLPISKNDVPAK